MKPKNDEAWLKSSPWVGNDGQPRAGNEIVADSVRFLDRAQSTDGEAGAEAGDVEDLPW